MSITPAPASFGETQGAALPEPRADEPAEAAAELVAYHDDLARAEAMEREQRRRDAEVIALRLHIADVENRHTQLLRSTSWKLGARLRRLLPAGGKAETAEAFSPRFRRYRAPGHVASRAPGRVDRLLAAARAGFPEAALADLTRLRDNWKASEEVRGLCERAMVLIEGESADPAVRGAALARLGALRHWGGGARDGAEIAFLERAISATLPGIEASAPDRFAINDWLSPDLMLLGPPGTRAPAERVAAISRAMTILAGVDLRLADPAGTARLDNLAADLPAGSAGGARVSVIVVAERAATLATALRSLRLQSWGALEILVVDDATTDATAAILAEAAAADARVIPIRAEAPLGLYAARNLALSRATGALVACLDAAAWAHPAWIERQARALLSSKGTIALRGARLRATGDLRFSRPPFATTLTEPDPAGLVFRREAVLERAGFWDAVALGGDEEFLARLTAIFGAKAIATREAPLTIARIDGTLPAVTPDRGAGRAYARRFAAYHAALPKDEDPAAARVAWPPAGPRPFAAPALILTGRPARGRHYDTILISDFRDAAAASEEELLTQVRAGRRTAVIQADRYGAPDQGMNADIQALIDAGRIDELTEGDRATADLVVIGSPEIFREPRRHLPEITAGGVRVVVDDARRRRADEPPPTDIEAARRNIADWLGQLGDRVPAAAFGD
ncbi:glycosyltransferase family A protein [Amaricoccus solimangrovi]|uniref:Glycosyltransferase family 2 protein n=1 Tax=Amaricoccus solimangrovi TaxID=2589815 RepID=A0A501X1A2_9RHOB|nr:glycosyltransferase family A protein [Amaricoccus solimangrovi]TPE53476.1 glycosyltransferase family 2 protein [Amaricoccus solimangrovi]